MHIEVLLVVVCGLLNIYVIFLNRVVLSKVRCGLCARVQNLGARLMNKNVRKTPKLFEW